jgi:uncharacterized Fe-S radical SAM superfamily protein PflX
MLGPRLFKLTVREHACWLTCRHGACPLAQLLMPDALEASRQNFDWLVAEQPPNVYVNVMDQCYPAESVPETERFPELSRKLRPDEHPGVVRLTRDKGPWRLDVRRSHTLLRDRMLV